MKYTNISIGDLQRREVHVVGDVLAFWGVGELHPVGVGLLDLAADDFHRTVDHVVLLRKRLRKHTDSRRKPPFRKSSGVFAAFPVRIDFLLYPAEHQFPALIGFGLHFRMRLFPPRLERSCIFLISRSPYLFLFG